MLPDLVFRTAPAPVAANLLDAAGPEPVVWLRRGQGFVGLGEAARCETTGPGRFAAAERWWQAVLARAQIEGPSRVPGMGPLALGAFAFSPTSPTPSSLVVPRLVVARLRGHEWVTTATPVGEEPTELPDADAPRPLPRLVEQPGPVAAADWPAVVSRAIKLIADSPLEKVVLARSVVARAANGQTIDPRAALRRLAERYADTWTFAVDGIIGATPEILLRSSRGLVTSRVLAGTIQRSGADQDNLARAASLARSSKDLEEHEFAVQSVVAALAPFVEELSVPEVPSVLHLPNVMHLATEVVGELRRARSGALPGALRLVAALHPSAAVCGTPEREAADGIGQLEGADRGRYAGPVGWIDQNGAGEWGLALRSAQLSADRREAHLWAGGGIVAASDPAAELAETEAKLLPMREALGLVNADSSADCRAR
ncbi:MAG: isochorismate synthase [Bifidobacteriaceae bacterium]|jgi:menaquinone-specific isochorismate synthase|nr:isochorismate synthase [Bifidobacteriaceae bacterium]